MSSSLSWLTPHTFDLAIIALIGLGLGLAVARIRNDFMRGPRWPEPTSQADRPASEPQTTEE